MIGFRDYFNLNKLGGQGGKLCLFSLRIFGVTFAMIVCLMCLISCDPPPDDDYERFKSIALELYQNDGYLSKEEMDSLKQFVKEAKSDKLVSLKDDTGEFLIDFLYKHMLENKLPVDKDAFSNPMSERFGMTLVVERSQSMEGYVSGATKFQTMLFDLVSSFESKFSVKPKVCLIGNVMECKNENVDLQRYTRTLNADSLRIKNQSVAGSDINAVIDAALEKVNDSNLVVLVSDFIFSPVASNCGEKKSRTKEHLVNLLEQQEVGIKTSFRNKILKYGNLSVLVLQFNSNFDGLYFDKDDCRITINKIRPYYVWFMGNDLQIAKLFNSRMLEELKGKYENRALFNLSGLTEAPTEIDSRAIKGSFDNDGLHENIIYNPKPAKDSLFSFLIYADFSKIFMDSSYFFNIANYRINTNYKLDSVNNAFMETNNRRLKNPTHKLYFTIRQNYISDAEIKVSLQNNLPEWINDFNCEDDSNIIADSTIDTKTFGLKYLLNGIHSAFASNKNSILTSFSFVLKKK